MSKRDREAIFYAFGQPCKLRINKKLAKQGFTPKGVVEALDRLLGRAWSSQELYERVQANVHAS